MTSLRSTVFSCLAVLGVLMACGETPPADPDPIDTPDASTPVSCDSAGVALCGDACVSTASDPRHCGGCGKACTSGEACESGVCTAVCRIDGTQVATGRVNPMNSCEQCTPAVSATAWTRRAEGTACNPGQVCSAGTCSPRCFIGGMVYDPGAANPENACETCVPETSTTQWTARGSVPLLVGGEDVVAQGWSVISASSSSPTYGPDYVRLETTTRSGARTSDQLLISRTNAFDPTKPFTLRVKMLVESVNNHNQLDSGAAILGRFTPPYGQTLDRSQMMYLDSGAIGWADETQSAQFTVTDGAYHDYELSVDAAKVATVRIDGVAKLTRNTFDVNGTIALGDQTNDPNVDGVVRIKSVERLCP